MGFLKKNNIPKIGNSPMRCFFMLRRKSKYNLFPK